MTGIHVTTPDLSKERALRRADGHTWVAGMDEVGRGAWAGPVSVGVALIPAKATKRTMPRWLRDSKQLSEARRESIFESVGAWCVDWAVGHATPEECDGGGCGSPCGWRPSGRWPGWPARPTPSWSTVRWTW